MLNWKRRWAETMKDVMWKKNESFCLETKVQDSELSVRISNQWRSDRLKGIRESDPVLDALDERTPEVPSTNSYTSVGRSGKNGGVNVKRSSLTNNTASVGFNEIQTLLRKERDIFSYDNFQLLSEETGNLGFYRRDVCKQELD